MFYGVENVWVAAVNLDGGHQHSVQQLVLVIGAQLYFQLVLLISCLYRPLDGVVLNLCTVVEGLANHVHPAVGQVLDFKLVFAYVEIVLHSDFIVLLDFVLVGVNSVKAHVVLVQINLDFLVHVWIYFVNAKVILVLLVVNLELEERGLADVLVFVG